MPFIEHSQPPEPDTAPAATCRNCGVPLTEDNWYASWRECNSRTCKSCAIAKRRDRRRNDGAYRRNEYAAHREWREADRAKLIAAYGGQCVKCGLSDPRVLDIDHVFDDGASERRDMSPNTMYARLRRDGYPRDRYQLLCKNCNWLKELERRALSRLGRSA